MKSTLYTRQIGKLYCRRRTTQDRVCLRDEMLFGAYECESLQEVAAFDTHRLRHASLPYSNVLSQQFLKRFHYCGTRPDTYMTPIMCVISRKVDESDRRVERLTPGHKHRCHDAGSVERKTSACFQSGDALRDRSINLECSTRLAWKPGHCRARPGNVTGSCLEWYLFRAAGVARFLLYA